ncbi:MAG: XTP/dITP diphosphatase [Nitrospirae bacterium]|nr:XTP/dITP diphosphatase [Nitrospirota bacterium]
MMEIVVATRNKRKVEEIKRILAEMPVKILTIEDFPECPEVEEDGRTFEENAVKKALNIARCTGKPSLADDSGLEVYALNGAPGVMSSRYAGPDSDDMKNIEKLLKEMDSLNDKKRSARFVCCIALAFPEGNIKTFFGYVEGIIGKEPKGSSGFGYDPVFYPEGHGRSFAEMSSEEKDALSHRGKALREFLNYIRDKIF